MKRRNLSKPIDPANMTPDTLAALKERDSPAAIS